MKSYDTIESNLVSKAVANNVSDIKPAPLKTPALQTQLKIGKPGDEYEQEADRVADQVMSMPESSVQQQPIEEEEEMLQPKPMIQLQPIEEEEEELMPKLQTQPLEEEEEMLQPKWIQREGCSSCGEREMPKLQTRTEAIQMSPLSHIESCSGQALPDSSRGFFEPRFGRSFSNVKVHTCESAVQMNQLLGAQAFAYGNNIFFNKGKYNPGSSDGKKLLAHELTHVVQQKQDKANKRWIPTPNIQTSSKIQREVTEGESLQPFRIALVDLAIVNPRTEVIATIREAFEPIVAETHRSLEIIESGASELFLLFSNHTVQSGGSCGPILLGNEGGQVWVGSHLATRVCCDPTIDSCRYPNLNLFIGEETELGRFIGNTAVHELAHQLGVGHSAAPDNYMYDGPCPIAPADRTTENRRQYFSQRLSFSPLQTLPMALNIIRNHIPGGMRITETEGE